MKMILDTKHLKKGMYVSELDRPWLDSPFLFQGFRITNIEEIEKLSEVCEYVFVDTEKSSVKIPPKLSSIPMQSTQKKQQIAKYIKPTPQYEVTFEQEYPKAKELFAIAQDRVVQVFSDIRMGKSLDVAGTKRMVVSMVDSVIRHPDALMLLALLRDKTDRAANHSLSVCTLAVTFGRFLGFDKDQLSDLGLGALLHDIGETKVPKEILDNVANCGEDEMKVFQDHTTYGAAIIHKTPDLPECVINIARDHHERANGSGYPQQLELNQLDIFTMVVAIVDVYDNITSGMYGIPALTCTDALKNIYTWREELFDTLLVEKFIQCLGIYPLGSLVELKSGHIGIVISINPETRLHPTVMVVRNNRGESMSPPRIINLSRFRDSKNAEQYSIGRVVRADEIDLDVRDFILREMPLNPA